MKTLILMTLISLSPNAFAKGGMSGGGGVGVVCRDSKDKIKSVETLDLFEAREIHKLKIKPTKDKVDEALAKVRTKLKNSMDQPEFHLFPKIDEMQKMWRFVGDNVVLKPTEDSAAVALPKNCQLEQIATYVDNELLLVKKEFWDNLDVINKVALILHEAIYRLDRYDGATNSWRTRKIVSYLLSDSKFEAVDADLPKNAKRCKSIDSNFTFYYYPVKNTREGSKEKTNTQLQFMRYDGHWMFSKTTALIALDGESWENSIKLRLRCNDWTSGECGSIAGGATKSVFNEDHGVTIYAQKESKKKNAKFKYFISGRGNTKHELNCTP